MNYSRSFCKRPPQEFVKVDMHSELVAYENELSKQPKLQTIDGGCLLEL